MPVHSIQSLARWIVALPLILVGALAANAASTTEQLAEFGHPNTKMCQLPEQNSKGLGKLLFVQFPRDRDDLDDQQKAVGILEIIDEALKNTDQRYVGFEAVEDWDSCLERLPEYIYWRDYNDN